MAQRKLGGTYLFDGYKFLENSVLILDELGNVEGIISVKEAGEGVEFYDGILCPGFINAHCHLELSHLKGLIPKHTGLVDFVFTVVTQRNKNAERILDSIKNAEEEMIKSGIVAVGDICNNTDTIDQKSKFNLDYYNFIEVSGWLPEVAEARFGKSEEFFRQYAKRFSKTSMVPHAPYSVSEKLWEALKPGFKGKTITIHNQEISDENLFFEKGIGEMERMYKMMNLDNSFFKPTGRSSLRSYFKNLETARNIILVHNTHISQGDIDFVNENKGANQQVFYCICINANLYIENEVPPVELLIKNNSKLVLGTDSLASNDQLDILEEMKSVKENFPAVETVDMLKWATINGAEALQMNENLGSFEKGKQPGVVFIDHTEGGNITTNSTSKRII